MPDAVTFTIPTQTISIPQDITVEDFCTDSGASYGQQMNNIYGKYALRQAQKVKKIGKVLPEELSKPFKNVGEAYIKGLDKICEEYPLTKTGKTKKSEGVISTSFGSVMVKGAKKGVPGSSIGLKNAGSLSPDDFNRLMQDVTDFEPKAFITDLTEFATQGGLQDYDSRKALLFINAKLAGASAENKKTYIREILLPEVPIDKTSEIRISELRTVPQLLKALAYTQDQLDKSEIKDSNFWATEKASDRKKKKTARKSPARPEAKKPGAVKRIDDLDDFEDLGIEEELADEFEEEFSGIFKEEEDTTEVKDELDDLLLDVAPIPKEKKVKIKSGKVKSSPAFKSIFDEIQILELGAFRDGQDEFKIGKRTVTMSEIIMGHLERFAEENKCAFDKTDLVEIIGVNRSFRNYWKILTSDRKLKQFSGGSGLLTQTHINKARKNPVMRTEIEIFERGLELTKDIPGVNKRCLEI